jgi:hypothetical protein
VIKSLKCPITTTMASIHFSPPHPSLFPLLTRPPR